MRIVLDTNVLVSALLSSDGAPAQVLTFVLAGELTVLFDARIPAEYEEVLARPRFAFDPADVAEVLRQLTADGEQITAAPSQWTTNDPDDLPFLEVALSGNADALVTGNARDFPKDSRVPVLSPRELLRKLDAE